MFFKNISLHKVELEIPKGEVVENFFNTYLKGLKPCGEFELVSVGFVNPVKLLEQEEDLEKNLCFVADNKVLVCYCEEKKVVPSSVVREFLNKKVNEIQTSENRKVRSKEKKELRESIIDELCKKAFVRHTYIHAYFDLTNNYLYINSTSNKKIDDFISLLGISFVGKYKKIEELITVEPMSEAMTKWITNGGESPKELEILETCELVDRVQSDSIVNCKKQDLTSTEIQSHIDAGKLVTKIELNWDEKLSFLIDDSFKIKKIKFLDIESVDEHENGEFYSNFLLMTSVFSEMVNYMSDCFGGFNNE